MSMETTNIEKEKGINNAPKAINPSIVPAWSDSNVELMIDAEKGYAEYSIYMSDKDGILKSEPIYTGRAYKAPDSKYSNLAVINITKIIQPFLESNYDTEGREYSYDYSHLFQIRQGQEWKGNYLFYNSYDYEDKDYVKFYPSASPIVMMNHPIQKTVKRDSTLTALLVNKGEGETTSIMYGYWKDKEDGQPQVMDEYGHVSLPPFTSGYFDVSVDSCPPEAKYVGLSPKGPWYRIQEPCPGSVTIYYMSPWGSMETYTPNGACRTSEVYESHEMKNNFDANWPDFEREKYMVEWKKRYICNFNLMKKEEAARLGEIAGSPKIWLQYSGNWRKIPVVCVDSNLDYSLDQKVRNYQITFEDSQSHIRK